MTNYTFTHDEGTAKTLLKGCARPRWASMIEHVNTDIDGHWIYVQQGYWVDGERGLHTIHEDTVAEALDMLKYVHQCMEDCPVCGAHYWDKTETLTCPQCSPVKADAPSDPIPPSPIVTVIPNAIVLTPEQWDARNNAHAAAARQLEAMDEETKEDRQCAKCQTWFSIDYSDCPACAYAEGTEPEPVFPRGIRTMPTYHELTGNPIRLVPHVPECRIAHDSQEVIGQECNRPVAIDAPRSPLLGTLPMDGQKPYPRFLCVSRFITIMALMRSHMGTKADRFMGSVQHMHLDSVDGNPRRHLYPAEAPLGWTVIPA